MFCLFCGICVVLCVFYCFCSIVLYVFLLCCVVCRFTWRINISLGEANIRSITSIAATRGIACQFYNDALEFVTVIYGIVRHLVFWTQHRSSAVAERPRDASCH